MTISDLSDEELVKFYIFANSVHRDKEFDTDRGTVYIDTESELNEEMAARSTKYWLRKIGETKEKLRNPV
jgi:hypothetical protein